MKKVSVIAAFFCLLFSASALFAQSKAASFTGTWELDLAKSKLDERNRVESMTLNVTQTDKDIKVETNSKRPPRPEGAARPTGDPNGGGGGNGGGMRPGGMGGGMGRGGMMGDNGTKTYTLDGKETSMQMEMPAGMPASSVMLKSKMEKDGKLKLMSTRNFDTPNGQMSIKTTETWELVDGGKGLKVTRDVESPRGTQTSEMYFTKKS